MNILGGFQAFGRWEESSIAKLEGFRGSSGLMPQSLGSQLVMGGGCFIKLNIQKEAF